MPKLLQVDFKHPGPWGEEMSNQLKELAESIAKEPGFIWKIWTENKETGEAGGIYLFEDEDSAKKYLEKHTARLQDMGYSNINGKIFDINEKLTEIDHGPLK